MLSMRKDIDMNGVGTITFDNIIKDERAFDLIQRIIEQFANGTELFWGHYRTDGFNISRKKMEQYSIEIPCFFKTYGEYYPINIPQKRNTGLRQGLTACRCPNNKKAYEMVEKIFHYYLETFLFCPNICWNDFLELHRNYMKHTTKEYIIKGYADFLFLYVDSGDFTILFDTQKYSFLEIQQKINALFIKK